MSPEVVPKLKDEKDIQDAFNSITPSQHHNLLCMAARQNGMEAAKYIAQRLPYLVYQRDADGMSPFLIAVKEHHLSMAHQLFQCVPEDVLTEDGRIGRFEAVILGTDGHGQNVFHHVAACLACTSRGATKCADHIKELMMLAPGNLGSVQRLGSIKSALKNATSGGDTPLHVAAASRHDSAVQMLCAFAVAVGPDRTVLHQLLVHENSSHQNVLACACAGSAQSRAQSMATGKIIRLISFLVNEVSSSVALMLMRSNIPPGMHNTEVMQLLEIQQRSPIPCSESSWLKFAGKLDFGPEVH